MTKIEDLFAFLVADGPHTEDISALLAAILGLVLVLVLVVMIFVIICKIRTKNRRKEKRDRRVNSKYWLRISVWRKYLIYFLFVSISSEIMSDNSKEDFTEIPDSGLKNPDVVPPIDGYALGYGGLDIGSDDFPQQIQPINSISSNRVSISTTINAQNISDFVSLSIIEIKINCFNPILRHRMRSRRRYFPAMISSSALLLRPNRLSTLLM